MLGVAELYVNWYFPRLGFLPNVRSIRSDNEYGSSGSKRPAAPTLVLIVAKVKDPHVKKSVLS